MNQKSSASGPNLNTFACGGRRLAAIGRTLLMLAALSLCTMPLTQRIWGWDHFLHGGQDFETGTLVILSILCLAVLLSHICKRRVDSWFVACRFFGFRLRDSAAGQTLRPGIFPFRTGQATDFVRPLYSLPLQI